MTSARHTVAQALVKDESLSCDQYLTERCVRASSTIARLPNPHTALPNSNMEVILQTQDNRLRYAFRSYGQMGPDSGRSINGFESMFPNPATVTAM